MVPRGGGRRAHAQAAGFFAEVISDGGRDGSATPVMESADDLDAKINYTDKEGKVLQLPLTGRDLMVSLGSISTCALGLSAAAHILITVATAVVYI